MKPGVLENQPLSSLMFNDLPRAWDRYGGTDSTIKKLDDSKNAGVAINGYPKMDIKEHPHPKRMMNGGTPISGNLHVGFSKKNIGISSRIKIKLRFKQQLQWN